MSTSVRTVLLGLAVAALARAQDGRRMAVPLSGPWNNDVHICRLDAAGRLERLGVFERLSVPTLARMPDGRLPAAVQYFPVDDPDRFDKIAVAVSSDEGRTSSSLKTARFSGLPNSMVRPFDPTLVSLPGGRVRLYFTGNFGRHLYESTPAIYSAVSTNGSDCEYEPGVRFGVAGRMVIDCAVVLHRGVFHLYAPDNGGVPGVSPTSRPDGKSGAARHPLQPSDRPRPASVTTQPVTMG